MECERETRFRLGVGIGVALGLLVGSVLMVRAGEDVARSVRSIVNLVTGRRDRPTFEALLQ